MRKMEGLEMDSSGGILLPFCRLSVRSIALPDRCNQEFNRILEHDTRERMMKYIKNLKVLFNGNDGMFCALEAAD